MCIGLYILMRGFCYLYRFVGFKEMVCYVFLTLSAKLSYFVVLLNCHILLDFFLFLFFDMFFCYFQFFLLRGLLDMVVVGSTESFNWLLFCYCLVLLILL
ncbi:unnamed protein product, partial [Wuchereria bancrofti]